MSEIAADRWNGASNKLPTFRRCIEKARRFVQPASPVTELLDAPEITRRLVPEHPVLCFSQAALSRRAKFFLDEFPGQVTYAVKANSALPVLQVLIEAGVTGYDVASLVEIEAVRSLNPQAELHYHNPAKSRYEIQTAYEIHGVRHFALDHEAEFEKLKRLTSPKETTLAVRFRMKGNQSAHDFTSKFGLDCERAAELLHKVAAAGYIPALTFHPGSQCYDPEAYSRHISAASEIARSAGVELSCLNVGGGFPAHYPHEKLPPLTQFFDAIQKTTLSAFRSSAPMICCEPGRAMVAPTTSLLMQVKLVRADQNDLFLNDGIYGGFLEPTQVPVMPPVRLIRNGKIITGEPLKKMTAYGPTCDPIDTLPAPVSLPKSVCEGDFLEFGFMGAYSTATATRFNGYGKIELANVQNVFQSDIQGTV